MSPEVAVSSRRLQTRSCRSTATTTATATAAATATHYLRFKLAVFLHFFHLKQFRAASFPASFPNQPSLPSCSPPPPTPPPPHPPSPPRRGVRSSFPNLRTRPPPRRHASLSSKGSRGAQPPCAVRDFDNSAINISIIVIIIHYDYCYN